MWGKKQRCNDYIKQLKVTTSKKLKEYTLLKQFMNKLNNKNTIPIRQKWESIITGKCVLNGLPPCLKCNGCWKKFVQLLIVIKCASGVADKVVIKHWNIIFHSELYNHYSLEDWNAVSYQHFATLCQPCSCWIKNCLYLKNYFQYLSWHKKFPIE